MSDFLTRYWYIGTHSTCNSCRCGIIIEAPVLLLHYYTLESIKAFKLLNYMIKLLESLFKIQNFT